MTANRNLGTWHHGYKLGLKIRRSGKFSHTSPGAETFWHSTLLTWSPRKGAQRAASLRWSSAGSGLVPLNHVHLLEGINILSLASKAAPTCPTDFHPTAAPGNQHIPHDPRTKGLVCCQPLLGKEHPTCFGANSHAVGERRGRCVNIAHELWNLHQSGQIATNHTVAPDLPHVEFS